MIELRQRDPLMPFSIFRLRTLRGANIVGLLIGMSLFSMFFFISLYLQDVLHYSPIKTGISYLPLAVGIILSAGAASQLVTRFGFKPPLIAGMLLIAGGLFWFSQVPATGGSFAADVLGPSLLAAVGLGLSFVPVTIAAVTGTEPHEAGLASGLINTSQQVGGALGLAILATVANSRTQSLLARRRAQHVDRAHQGLRPRVPRRRRLRRRRSDPGRRADLLARQPRTRKGGSQRRVRGRRRRCRIRSRRRGLSASVDIVLVDDKRGQPAHRAIRRSRRPEPRPQPKLRPLEQSTRPSARSVLRPRSDRRALRQLTPETQNSHVSSNAIV